MFTIMAYRRGRHQVYVNRYSDPKAERDGHRLGREGLAESVRVINSRRFLYEAVGDENYPGGCARFKEKVLLAGLFLLI